MGLLSANVLQKLFELQHTTVKVLPQTFSTECHDCPITESQEITTETHIYIMQKLLYSGLN